MFTGNANLFRYTLPRLPLALLALARGPGSSGESCSCDGHGVQACDGDSCGPCIVRPRPRITHGTETIRS